MATLLDELHYPVLCSAWGDKNKNKRVHIVYNLPSGMIESDLENFRVEGDEFKMDLDWSTDMFSVKRVLNHSRFKPVFTVDHPKWIALKKAMGELKGRNQNRKVSYQSHVKVKLPDHGYDFTPRDVCNHNAITVVIDQHSTNVSGALDTVFCVIDLWKEKEPDDCSDQTDEDSEDLEAD